MGKASNVHITRIKHQIYMLPG